MGYQNNLKITAAADEQFDTLPGGSYHENLQLENVGLAHEDEESPSKRGRKRKMTESPEKSAYLKRQEALAKQQEEFLEEEKRRRETLRSQDAPSTSLQASFAQEGWPAAAAATPDQTGFNQLASPAYSGYGAPPSLGYPTPVHEQSYPQQQFDNTNPQTSFTEQWVNQVQSNPPS